jgi:hypothetical protein
LLGLFKFKVEEEFNRQRGFSIPKQLRIYFLFDRKLLGKLSKCAWKVLRTYFNLAALYSDIVPGASIVVQTYGDFLNVNPHLHTVMADGYFFDDNSFRVALRLSGKNLAEAFRYEVLKQLPIYKLPPNATPLFYDTFVD